MEWLVYWFDPNKGEIVRRNVFNLSATFNKELATIAKNMQADKTLSYKDVEKEILSAVMYSFWCKAEHEIFLVPWGGSGKPLKIDVCDQLRLNWKAFVDYTWNWLVGFAHTPYEDLEERMFGA